jgi:outer membrane protein OmpA-like peptidoglycan-associated protein
VWLKEDLDEFTARPIKINDVILHSRIVRGNMACESQQSIRKQVISSARISIESHTDTVAKSAPDFSPELVALQASVQGQQSSPSSSDSVALEAKRLTEAQANAIEYYWRQRGAFAPGQLTARAAGASQPIMENQTPAGRATNRRVEFTLYGFR